MAQINAIAVQCLAVSADAHWRCRCRWAPCLSQRCSARCPACVSMLAACLGLALDARSPKYDWTSVYEAGEARRSGVRR